MKNVLMIIFTALALFGVLACDKSDKDNSKNNDVIIEDIDRSHRAYESDYYKVKLENGNTFSKIKSGSSEKLAVDFNADYDIIFTNIIDKTKHILITDKFNKLKLLPVMYNETIQKYNTGSDSINTQWSKCFILQILDDKTYKLIYIDDFNNDYIQKEYIYKNSFHPDLIKITIAPHFFIVMHEAIDGIEYILIDQKTGICEIIDSEEEEGH
ncbi:MAG: hypothetical protein Ta2G_18230 [Termitinemataceae bacterium]|nr:MAG: hypothetical protein Ta2G_18230 [Termitinemataceae bacterium]